MAARDVKIYGKNAALALFSARPDDVRRAFVHERLVPELGDMLRELAKRRVAYRVVSDEELTKVAGAQHHEGVCLVARPQEAPDEAAIQSARRGAILYIDGVENPHNVGAMLRSAAHFGALAIAGAHDRMPAPAGAVARVAEGGAERVPMLRWEDPERSLKELAKRGWALAGTAHDAERSLFGIELPARCVFLMGAEGTGLSPKVRALAQRMIAIPGTGAVESLNVSVACAVLLAEHYRQHAR
jgi:TrmH RNA methyltransferase